MSWYRKWPGSKVRYYYKSQRIGGKSVKVYVGRGPVAELVAQLDQEERRLRLAERDAFRAELLRLDLGDLALERVRSIVNLLTRATLVVNGYHEHHGEWRRRSGQGQHT